MFRLERHVLNKSHYVKVCNTSASFIELICDNKIIVSVKKTNVEFVNLLPTEAEEEDIVATAEMGNTSDQYGSTQCGVNQCHRAWTMPSHVDH